MFVRLIEGELSTSGITDSMIELAQRASTPLHPASPRVIELHAHKVGRSVQPAFSNVIALAAQDSQSRQRFTVIGTLTSHDKASLVRIVRDNDTGQVLGQIMSDNATCYDHPVISFDGIPGAWPADSSGEIRLSLSDDVAMSDLHAFIHLPVATFHLPEDVNRVLVETGQFTFTSDAWELTLQREGSNLVVHGACGIAAGQLRFMQLVDGGDTTILEFHEGVCSLPWSDLPASQTALFYT